MVRLYRTFSIYIVTGETRSAGCLCNFIEPPHYTSIVPVCRVLSHHQTSIPTAVQEIQCVQGGCALVRGGSSTSNLIESLHEPHHHRDRKVCRGLSHEFRVVRPYRTFSMYIVTGETRSAGCLCTSSGWFKHIEPHRTSSNLLEPQHHRDSKVWRGLSHEFGVVQL